MTEKGCVIFPYNTSLWANSPIKILLNISTFGGRDIVVWLFFFRILSRLTTFCPGGICSISSFQKTGTAGTGGFEDTSIGSIRDMGKYQEEKS